MDAGAQVVEEARRRAARLVGVTGGVAVGKSTVAGVVAGALGAATVATDGFLHRNATLAELGLSHRKGFPESFDAPALQRFLDGWLSDGTGEAPVYSHLAYDVVGSAAVAADRLVVEGLHLGHQALGVRDRFDLLVHLEAADDDAARWYLDRFRGLRALAAEDPAAFLHPYGDVPAEAMEAMAMDVWRNVNLVVLEEAVRPWAHVADLVLVVGPDREVVEVHRPDR